MPRKFHVYLLTNKYRSVLYCGVTSDIARRLSQHKRGNSQFTRKYKVHILVYVEEYMSPMDAIHREKDIKRMSRLQKNRLVEESNPNWDELPLPLDL